MMAGLLALVGCQDGPAEEPQVPEEPAVVEPEILLTTPENDAVFNLNEIESIAFGWQELEDIKG